MTTIIVTPQLMVADSQCSYGDTKQYTRKIFRLKDGSIAGIAGDLPQGYELVRWLNDETPNPPTKVDDCVVLVLRPDGTMWEFCGSLCPMPITESYHAAGSGMASALGALDAGATPQQAVEIAIKRDAYSGGTVVVERLKTFAKPRSKSLKVKVTKSK